MIILSAHCDKLSSFALEQPLFLPHHQVNHCNGLLTTKALCKNSTAKVIERLVKKETIPEIPNKTRYFQKSSLLESLT